MFFWRLAFCTVWLRLRKTALSRSYLILLIPLLGTLELAAVTPPAAQEMLSGSSVEEVATTLDQLRELAGLDQCSAEQPELDTAHQAFYILLDELGQQIDEARVAEIIQSAEACLDKSLIAMAADRIRSPELCDELIREYGEWGAHHMPDGRERRARGGFRPGVLMDKHCSEEYRIAWESLILAPLSVDTRYMMRGALIVLDPDPPSDIRRHALGRIGNVESLPVLMWRTRQGLVKQPSDVILALQYFPSEEGLGCILECMEIWEANSEKPIVTGKGALEEWVIWLLTFSDYTTKHKYVIERLDRLEKWREVIEKFPKDGLPPDQREILEQVLAFERETDEGSEAP